MLPPSPRRVAAQVAAVVISALLAFGWGVIATGHRLSEPERARRILVPALRAPVRVAVATVAAQVAAGQSSGLEPVDEDLVAFDARPDLTVANAGATAEAILESRALELYEEGLPPDPGLERTQVGLPRSVLNQLTSQRHEVLARASTAGLVALAAGLVLAAAMGSRWAFFALPGTALAVAWVLGVSQRAVVSAVLDKASPTHASYVALLDEASAVPLQRLAFGSIALLAAAAIFRTLLPGPRRQRGGKTAVVTESE